MMKTLEELLFEREISYDAEDMRIMCFPHTINIAVQHVLKKMSSVLAPENDEYDFEELTGAADADEGRGYGQTFEEACAEDPIARLRKIVVAIRSSGQRRAAFVSWIETGNQNKMFVLQNKVTYIQPRQLLQDVRTRWDSTYQMIKRCVEMRLVSPCTQIRDLTLICFRPSIPSSYDQEVTSAI